MMVKNNKNINNTCQDHLVLVAKKGKDGESLTCFPGNLPPRGFSRKNMGWPP